MSDNLAYQGRADRLLRPESLEGLERPDDEQLLTLRDEAVDEENQISYVRRLLQGRLDLLRFEKERRTGSQPAGADLGAASDDRALARALGKVLTAPPTGELPVLAPGQSGSGVDENAVSAHRRAAEAAAGDVRLSDAKTLDDAALDAALQRIAAFEVEVSRNRRRLQRAADTVLEEVARRVEAGRLPADQLPAAKHGDPNRVV
ncbi:MAG: hypothetical protein ACLGIA_12180 [Actinomycetes bacterium]